MEETLDGLEKLAARVRDETDRILVLGMGGSSLAPLVFASSFGAATGSPRLEVLDSTEPASVLAAANAAPPDRTIYVVSSKSGTTLEPNLFFDYFFALAEKGLGPRAGERFVVITDPGTTLEREASSRRVRQIFPGDPAIGGRYSALSPFGIVPAALSGIDVRALLSRARAMADACRTKSPEANPGVGLGAAMGALALEGRDKLTFSVGSPVDRFGMWIEQLIAESTGKEGKGILPVEGEPPGAPEAYGDDRFFVRIAVDSQASDAARRISALEEAGHPVVRFDIADALDLGAEMFRWEFATAVAGRLLGINPFDQPNVQEAKDRTNQILSGQAAPEPSGAGGPEALSSLIASIRPRDYFAITAYLPSTAANEERLARIRLPVRDGKRVATTVGFGPRFLHSTGQFHKGGPDTGVFLQITEAPLERVPVPSRSYGFDRVVAAQAAGDLAALRSRQRRALSISLGADPAAELASLAAAVGKSASR